MFFLLLAHPKGLTKEAIGAILWPESTGPQLNRQFKNAIYRLRRALGKDIIHFLQDRGIYTFNHSMNYWYDVDVFQALLAEARSTTDLATQNQIRINAINVYQGAYLVEIDSPWTSELRIHLQREYRQALLDIAEFHFSSDDLSESLHYCRHLLSEDACQEAGHRLIMRIHAARGNRTEIARQYRQCEQTLHKELDTTPSPETNNLYHLLMN